MTLEEITSTMSAKIGEKGGINGKTVMFDLGDSCITVDGKSSPAVVNNERGDADCTIKLDLDLLGKLIAGEQNPQMAFMSGKLKVEGDMGIAMQISSLL